MTGMVGLFSTLIPHNQYQSAYKVEYKFWIKKSQKSPEWGGDYTGYKVLLRAEPQSDQ